MLFLVELFPKENYFLIVAMSESCAPRHIFGRGSPVCLMLLMCCERLKIWVCWCMWHEIVSQWDISDTSSALEDTGTESSYWKAASKFEAGKSLE